MCYRVALTICLIVLANNIYADRPGLDPKSVQGTWRVVRLDFGRAGAQARLVPDGPITLRIEKSGIAELMSGDRSLVKGRLHVDAKGKFQFEVAGNDINRLNGTWGGDGRRLILSFIFQGVPASVLLQPQPMAPPTN